MNTKSNPNDPKMSDGLSQPQPPDNAPEPVRSSALLGDAGTDEEKGLLVGIIRSVTITEVISSDGRRKFSGVQSECRSISGQPLSDEEASRLARSYLEKASEQHALAQWAREREVLSAGRWSFWPGPAPILPRPQDNGPTPPTGYSSLFKASEGGWCFVEILPETVRASETRQKIVKVYADGSPRI